MLVHDLHVSCPALQELLTQHGAVRGPATKDPQRHHFFGYGPPLSLQQSHRRGGQFHYAFGTQQNMHPKIIVLGSETDLTSLCGPQCGSLCVHVGGWVGVLDDIFVQ